MNTTVTFTNNTNKHLVIKNGSDIIARFDTEKQAEQYVNDNFVCGIMDFVAPGETVTNILHFDNIPAPVEIVDDNFSGIFA